MVFFFLLNGTRVWVLMHGFRSFLVFFLNGTRVWVLKVLDLVLVGA